ncbi:MAG: 2-dehydropantoate 2-reductase [Deltaproteobacteria bacterium]|jgi:2-dehydropantoate 2-reductase|nr:2-dehydropantoate 2-reductase [Deltaproteobacteria bacterium]
MQRTAIIGVGATGSVLAAALLTKHPETFMVGRNPARTDEMGARGLKISGAINYSAPVKNYTSQIGALRDARPDLIFIASKTFHLSEILQELEQVYTPGTKIIATQNGLGVEDLIAEKFGPEAVYRMSLNFGVALKGPGEVSAAFFNPPNHLGGFTRENRELGFQIAKMLSACGLDTEYVDDIRLSVWKKMIMKCTMAAICAVTDKTIKDALEYPPTREIADACFEEALAVARSMGYDPGENYLQQALGYLQKVGVHKDSMCNDIASRAPTEIDFLGGKIVEYARNKGISTPFYVAMTNLVKSIESNYLDR